MEHPQSSIHACGIHVNSTLQLVKQCNEGAHKMERTEQMYTLHTQLDFGKVKVGALPTHPPHCCPHPRSHRLLGTEVGGPLELP